MTPDIQKAIDSAIASHERRLNLQGWLIILILFIIGELFRRVVGVNGVHTFIEHLVHIGNMGRWLW